VKEARRVGRAQPITAYDPPGFLPDFDGVAHQREQWSAAVSRWFDESINAQSAVLDGQPCQYYNQLAPDPPRGPAFKQEIVWNAFPGTLRRRWGRTQALLVGDHLLPLDQRMDEPAAYHETGQWADLFYRPQDEYCEWRVERDPKGRIVRVTFTSEPPEYWQALHGDTLETDGGELLRFTGDPNRVLDLYREYVDPSVILEDLVCPVDLLGAGGQPLYRAGDYNPYNRWNTTHGIMHLTHPSNTLQAEIRLGADATVLRTREQRLVADSDTLIACAGYGGDNRCSDPTIGGSVNQLAALGYGVTLANPVGLYMDHLDMTGWEIHGEPIDADWFQVVRGQPGLIERAVFEVPSDKGTVSDVRIAGELVRFGGQLAERMTVKLVGLAAIGAHFTTRPAQFGSRAIADPQNPWMVISLPAEDEVPFGTIPVLDYPEAVSAARIAPAPPKRPAPHPRPRWSRAA
jgi:hypothetical protein